MRAPCCRSHSTVSRRRMQFNIFFTILVSFSSFKTFLFTHMSDKPHNCQRLQRFTHWNSPSEIRWKLVPDVWKEKKLSPLIATNESSDNLINTRRGGHI